jgi:hypothetical protein
MRFSPNTLGNLIYGLLNEFAADPYPYLDEAGKKKMKMAYSDLLRKFTHMAFDESAEMRWQESERMESNGNEAFTDESDFQWDLKSERHPF